MFDAHVRAWKRHLGAVSLRKLIEAHDLVLKGWRLKWLEIEKRNESAKDRPWRT
jgi:hypothetical protein